jgi:hypothetical protein
MGRRAISLIAFILGTVAFLVACNRDTPTATPQPTAAVALVAPTVTAVPPTATSTIIPSRTPSAPSRTPAPTRTPTPHLSPTATSSPTPSLTPTITPTPRPPTPTLPPVPTISPLSTCPPEVNGPVSTETGQAHILWVGPQPGRNARVHPYNQIVIAFDQPMDHTLTEAAFQVIGYYDPVEAVVNGTFSWCENTLVFQPSNRLDPYTNYSITLDPSAVNANGQPILEEPFYFGFATSGRELVHFGWGTVVQSLASSGPRILPFKHSPFASTRLNASLYQLDQLEFLEIYNYFAGTRFPSGYSSPKPELTVFEHWQIDVPPAEFPYSIRELSLPQQAPPGWYLLELNGGEGPVQFLIILSDLTLMVTELREETAVWVTGHDGQPRPGVQVQFHDVDGSPIVEGVTDTNGLFQIATNELTAAPAFVTASQENDVAITVYNPRWRTGYDPGDVHCEYDWPIRPHYTIHFYTDSSVYHAGDTVSFKAVILQDEDGVLSPLPVDTAVSLQVINSAGVMASLVMRTDETSTVHGQFQISPTLRESQQTITLSFNAVQRQYPLEIVSAVTTPEPDDAQVQSTVATQPYGSNQPLTIAVEVRDAAGQPLANIPVGLTMFERYPWGWDTVYAALESGVTGADGRYVAATLQSFPDSFGAGPWAIRIDAVNKQFWQFIPALPLPPVATIQLDTEGIAKFPGQTFTVQGRMLNAAGEPMAGRTLAVEVYGGTHYSPPASVLELAATITTDGDGRFTQSFVLERNDDFVIVAKGQDDQGQAIVASAGIYILGLGDNDYSGNLNVVPERNSYTPGETATIYVESNFSGPALLSVEGGTLRRAMTVTLNAPITTLSLPILPDDAPNISVNVQAWHPLETSLVPEIDLDRTDANIEVRPPILNITITPPQTPLAAGQEGEFTLQVTDAQGLPVVATTSLSLASEIAHTYGTESITTLYRPREHPWRSYDNLSQRRRWEIYPLNTGCGGDDDDEVISRWLGLPFPAPAVWLPTITTDESGQATVTLTMPDTPGDWRLTVKAVAAGAQVGETSLVVPVE